MNNDSWWHSLINGFKTKAGKNITITALISLAALAGYRVVPASWNEPATSSEAQTTESEVTPSPSPKLTTVSVRVWSGPDDEALRDVEVEFIMSDGTLIQPPRTGSDGYTDHSFSADISLSSIRLRKAGYESIDLKYTADNYPDGKIEIELIERKEEPSPTVTPAIPAPSSRNTPPTSIPSSGMAGYWDADIDVYKDISFNDSSSSSSNSVNRENYKLVLSFTQTGNELLGKVIEASNNGCKNAPIVGTVQGNNISLEVQYKEERCCKGATLLFDGELSSSRTVTGTFSPGNEPTTDTVCTLWWANVTMRPIEG